MHIRIFRIAGFTLIETVITLGIFTIMMLALYSFFISSNSTFTFQNAYIQTHASAGEVTTAITTAALPGSNVLASHVFGTMTLFSGSGTLVLEVPSIDSSGNIVTGKFDYYGFYTTGSSVYQILEPDVNSARPAGTKLLTTDLNALIFTYDNTDFTLVRYVNADVKTQSTIKGQQITSHLQQTIYLRNKL